MSTHARLGFRLWLDLRLTAARAWLRPCPTCRRRPRRWPTTPRHDQDRVARMLGIPVAGHCPDCGKADR